VAPRVFLKSWQRRRPQAGDLRQSVREPTPRVAVRTARRRRLDHSIERRELAGLWKDVRFPEWLDPAKEHAALWFGPAGTVTPLHHDQCNILFCQIHGRKRVRMLPPTETFLHRGAMSMYAAADPESPDLRAFPEWKDAHVIDVVVEPGEALFIPVGWWHHVRSLDVAISLSLTHFRYRNEFRSYCPGALFHSN
jgi:ribosomal protein L16 Arg81 hydroxylase